MSTYPSMLPILACAAFPALAADDVGRDACTACHADIVEAWRGSHHDLAMQEANAETVQGDFNDAQFDYHGIKSRFFRREGRYMVETDNAEGRLQAFEIAYTFGAVPLQQYLVAFPGGRLQALSLAWDTRPAENGGQRWFHLYPDAALTHADPLHWTGIYQNWNRMCAECHSTGLRKNYDLESDTYASRWSEIDVSCEACHGPASDHLAWTRQDRDARPASSARSFGFALRLGDPLEGEWRLAPGARTAVRSTPFDTTKTLEVCARCHARRATLTDDYRHGQPLLDTHAPALLTAPLYYPDGQIREEVYVYGSFLQSRMYRAGVACSDCHDPHTLALKRPGNALCTRCHRAAAYDTAAHHHHAPGSDAAACVACHMPSRTYMLIDPRRDHSLRIPRPDLSADIGVPNPCNDCHAGQTPQWAAGQVRIWYPLARDTAEHYGGIIAAGRRGEAAAGPRLARLAIDREQAAIVRATALSLLGGYPYPGLPQLLQTSLGDTDALIRTAALSVMDRFAMPQRLALAKASLADPVRLVRVNAARLLLELARRNAPQAAGTALRDALGEYLRVQQYNADGPEGLTALGTYQLRAGEPREAEVYFRRAVAKAPSYAPASVNLAELYRIQGRDAQGELVLRQALESVLDPAPVHHSLGLLLVREQRRDEALNELRQAAELAPEQARYAYVYGVALESARGPPAAVDYLGTAYARHPNDPDILLALVSFSREIGDEAAAHTYTEALRELLSAPTAAAGLKNGADR